MFLRHLYITLLSALFISTTIIASPAKSHVRLGVNELLTQQYRTLVAGKRVAVVANNASRDSSGRRDITLLDHNPQIKLVAIFTPEHGLGVNLDNDHIANSQDPITHLPVYSLYGRHRAPTRDELKHVDVILFDLQSVGLRYYTYIATLAHVMNMAKTYHKQIIILDRPNPLGGNVVAGPLLDHDYVGDFTSYFNIPMRYGLTIGELARYYNTYDHKHVNLKVIPMRGWRRNLLFNQTDLAWVATSPALQTFQQAYLYAIFGPLESTRLSFGVGRAGTQEYHLFGAPYITAAKAHLIVHKLQALHLPGLTFHYHAWRPVGGMYRHRWCHGIEVNITDYHKVRGFYTTVATLKVFYDVLGHRLDLIGTDNMLGQRWVRRAIADDQPVSTIVKRVAQQDALFMKKRQRILLYK